MKKISLFWIAIILFLTACQKNENIVVVYTSVDQVFSEPILKKFEKQTGIKVKALFDTEEAKSTGVLNRIIAEKDNPQCDVFWSGDPVRTVVLKQKNLTQPYFSPNAEDIPQIYKDKDGHWTGFSARTRVLIYNKKLCPDTLVPKSIFELTQKKYFDKIAMANPLFGTTTFHIAALFEALGDDSARIFLNNLKKNGLKILVSNGDVKDKVSKGLIPCGLTDTDDAFEALEQSDEVAFILLDQKTGFGTLIMPNTVCLIKNAPHSENAKKLIDFLLSEQTEIDLYKSAHQIPLHKNLKLKTELPPIDSIVPMQIDYNATAVKLETLQNWLKEWINN